MKYVITITVRMKSTRLPKKVLLKIKNKMYIEHLIERLKKIKKVSGIILCTSKLKEDDILVKIAKDQKILYYRGHPDDVLIRIFNAGKKFGADVIISITGDNIFQDCFINEMIVSFEENNADYVFCNELPVGIAPHLIRLSALEDAIKRKNTTDTEIWGGYLNRPDLYKVYEYRISNPKYIHPEWRLTLDYPEDFELMKKIFDELYDENKYISFDKVMSLLIQNPKIIEINKGRKQISSPPLKLKND